MLSDSRLSSSQATLRCIGTVSNAPQKYNTNKSQKVQGCQKNTHRGGGVVRFLGEQRKHKISVACGLNTRKTTHVGCLLSSLIRDCLHHRQYSALVNKSPSTDGASSTRAHRNLFCVVGSQAATTIISGVGRRKGHLETREQKNQGFRKL